MVRKWRKKEMGWGHQLIVLNLCCTVITWCSHQHWKSITFTHQNVCKYVIQQHVTWRDNISISFWHHHSAKVSTSQCAGNTDDNWTCIAREWQADCCCIRIINREIIMFENTHRCCILEPTVMSHKNILKSSRHLHRSTHLHTQL